MKCCQAIPLAMCLRSLSFSLSEAGNFKSSALDPCALSSGALQGQSEFGVTYWPAKLQEIAQVLIVVRDKVMSPLGNV